MKTINNKSISILSMILFLLLGTIFLTASNEVNEVKAANQTTNINQKHSINEVITYIDKSIYDPLSNQYINYATTENDEVYIFYSDKQLKDTWQVLIIDTKGNNDIKDDEVINTFYLGDYIFSNS